MKKIIHNPVFKIIVGIIKTIFIILIAIYLLFIVLQRVRGNRSVFGYRLFTVATGSMAGVYDINDVIAVRNWNIDDLKIGDDIAFQGTRGGLEGKLITHRIIRIEESEDGEGKLFVTKGVQAPAEDPAIRESQILGKVVGVVPIITQLNHIVKTQLGFFALIFCPLVLIIVLEVLQTITDFRLEKNEIQEIEKKTEEKKEITEEQLTPELIVKDSSLKKNDFHESDDLEIL